MTIYAAPVAHAALERLAAGARSALALPVGEFSIINRKDDGTRQWAYRGEALYTYAGDYAPGEVTGIFTGDKSDPGGARLSQLHATRRRRSRHYRGRGPLMTTSKG